MKDERLWKIADADNAIARGIEQSTILEWEYW